VAVRLVVFGLGGVELFWIRDAVDLAVDSFLIEEDPDGSRQFAPMCQISRWQVEGEWCQIPAAPCG